MRAARLATLILGIACTLAACGPAPASSRRDRQPDTDPLEADRPAGDPAQRPVAPILTR